MVGLLLSAVEKSEYYVFEDDNAPHSPQGKGFKLCPVGI